MKKKLLIALCVVMAVSLAVGTTFAYFTDHKSIANTFTAGKVKIEFTEDFEQGSALVPGREIKKEGIVTNVGSEDAYVWVAYSIPTAAYDYIELYEAGTIEKNYDAFVHGTKEINGEEYTIYVYLFTDVFAPGEYDYSPLGTVTLATTVDYNHNDGKYYSVEKGVATLIDYNFDDFIIYAEAFAVQASEFADYDEAFRAIDEQWSGKHFDTATYVNSQAAFEAAAAEANTSVVLASDKTFELPETIAAGVTISGGENTVIDTTALVEEDAVLKLDNVTFENVSIAAEGHAFLDVEGSFTVSDSDFSSDLGSIFYNTVLDGDLVIENSTISAAVYAMNIVGSGNVTIKNSTISGWTSFGSGVNATIENCVFAECVVEANNTLRFYADATVINTEFNTKMQIDALDASADVTITLDGCTVSGGADLSTIISTDNNNGKTVTFDIK